MNKWMKKMLASVLLSAMLIGDVTPAFAEEVSNSVFLSDGTYSMDENGNLIEVKENFSKKPDLLLIDGGFGQLTYAKQAQDKLGTNIPMISLAEKNEEICTLNSNIPIMLKKSDEALKLLQRVRDEAHRFAITYHRTLRGKYLKSSLSEIEGLGTEKIKALLKYFKSVENVSKATKSELEKVDGIGKNLAETIFRFYHEEN